MAYDKNKSAVVLTINAAQGEFGGDRAFGGRVWNVRVHMNPDWKNLTQVTVNGTPLSAEEIKKFVKSASAQPFAFEGAAPDGDICQFAVSGSVKQAYTVELYFGATVNSAVNEDYDDTATEFTLRAAGAVSSVNLSQSGSAGWISYGDDGTAKAVGNGQGVFGYPQTRTVGSGRPACATSASIAGCAGSVSKTYTDGDTPRSSNAAVYTNQFFRFEVNTVGKRAEYVLILGGSNSTAKVTVRDRAGNVRTVYFGNINGEWTQKIVIECPETADGTLYVDFAAVATSKKDSGGYPNETLLVSEEALRLYGCYAALK